MFSYVPSPIDTPSNKLWQPNAAGLLASKSVKTTKCWLNSWIRQEILGVATQDMYTLQN